MVEFLDLFRNVWSTAIFGIGVGPTIMGLLVFIFVTALRGLFARYVTRFFARLARRTETSFDDDLVEALDRPIRFVFVILGIYAGGQVMQLSPELKIIEIRLLRSLIIFAMFWAILRCVNPLSFLVDRLTRIMGADMVGESLKGFFIKIIKFLIFCIGIAAILEEWNFNVAALLGGLGLVGMAVAFGAQNMMSNLFASIMILLDQVFEKGDWVRGGGVEGTVEVIGFRTTKIRRFDKALSTVPNSVLIGGPIINFSRMTHRRIYWKIGLTYKSTEAQLRAVLEGLRQYILGNDAFESDPGKATLLINVDSFNSSSIDIMLYCFTKTTNWGEWMDIKQALAFHVKNLVEEAGTSFAFPSSSLYVEQWPLGTPERFPLNPEKED